MSRTVEELEREVCRLREALASIVDADAYLNCVCGRGRPRISPERRNAALSALGRKP